MSSTSRKYVKRTKKRVGTVRPKKSRTTAKTKYRTSSSVQAILFDRNYYTLAQTKTFLKRHGLSPIKEVHKTDKYYRYRLTVPSKRKFSGFRIKEITPSLKFVIGIRRK